MTSVLTSVQAHCGRGPDVSLFPVVVGRWVDSMWTPLTLFTFNCFLDQRVMSRICLQFELSPLSQKSAIGWKLGHALVDHWPAMAGLKKLGRAERFLQAVPRRPKRLWAVPNLASLVTNCYLIQLLGPAFVLAVGYGKFWHNDSAEVQPSNVALFHWTGCAQLALLYSIIPLLAAFQSLLGHMFRVIG